MNHDEDAMELIGRPNEELAFPLIADPDRSIVTELGTAFALSEPTERPQRQWAETCACPSVLIRASSSN
eukprot:1710221-Amphidinium_carterae.3